MTQNLKPNLRLEGTRVVMTCPDGTIDSVDIAPAIELYLKENPPMTSGGTVVESPDVAEIRRNIADAEAVFKSLETETSGNRRAPQSGRSCLMPAKKKSEGVELLTRLAKTIAALTELVEAQGKRISELEKRPCVTEDRVKDMIYDHAPMVGVNDSEETQQ